MADSKPQRTDEESSSSTISNYGNSGADGIRNNINADDKKAWFSDVAKGVAATLLASAILGVFGLVIALSAWRAEVDKELSKISVMSERIKELESKIATFSQYPNLSNLRTDDSGLTISGDLSVLGNAWGTNYDPPWIVDGDEALCPKGYFVAGLKIQKTKPSEDENEPIENIQFFCREL